jgi:hypothetical protein
MTKYYGCEVVKDEEAYKLDLLLTDKESFLDFISQLRTLTKSDEPLILLPTRKKGKSSSAKMGSCHWAVTKMIEQHLGKIFCGYSIFQSSTAVNIDNIFVDNNINCLDAAFHSAWLTPEEKAVNLINYTNQILKKNKKLEKIMDYLEFQFPNHLLFLPTNKHCYFKITPQGEYTYNNVSFFHKRKKSIFKYEIIKKLGAKTPIELFPNDISNHSFGPIDYKKIKPFLDKIVMIKNFVKERVTTSINNNTYYSKNFPNLLETLFSTDFKNNFTMFTKYLDPKNVDLFKELKKKYNEENNNWIFNLHFLNRDSTPLKSKDLFSKPSLISKKYHYEQGNHPLFDDRIEYRTIDKNEVNDEIKRLINSMSQSQKNYEIKRAEKKGITLEQYILKQKFKLSN